MLIPAVHIAHKVKSVCTGSPFSVNPSSVVKFMEAEILVRIGKINKSAASAHKLTFLSLIVLHTEIYICLKGQKSWIVIKNLQFSLGSHI